MAQQEHLIEPGLPPGPPNRPRRAWRWAAAGAAGLLVVVVVVVSMSWERDHEAAQPEGPATAFGQQQALTDNVVLEVSTPRPYGRDGRTPVVGAERLMTVTVKVINNRPVPYHLDSAQLRPRVTFGGQAVQPLHGPGSVGGADSAAGSEGGNASDVTILSGRSFTYQVVVAVGAMPGELRLEFHTVDGVDIATFKGTT